MKSKKRVTKHIQEVQEKPAVEAPGIKAEEKIEKTVEKVEQKKTIQKVEQKKPVQKVVQKKPIEKVVQKKPVQKVVQKKPIEKVVQKKPAQKNVQKKPVTSKPQPKVSSTNIQPQNQTQKPPTFIPPPMSSNNPISPFQPQQQIPIPTLYRRPQPPQPTKYENIQIYNDDQPIIQKVKQQKSDAKIQIQIKAQRSIIKLKQQIILPTMCSLKTSGGSRSNLDLICVIDVSGSMNGEKIQLVKNTMKYVLEALTPSDRVSIITFESVAKRVCALKCVTGENMQAFNNYINQQLYARGGTNINAGLQLALKTIRQRKHENKVTSIFLLSDGQDKGAEHTFRESLKQKQNQSLGIFSIHSFGFGTDHDQDLMTRICQMKDGSFYFIKQLSTLDQAFCNALGGVISLVATDVIIKITNISENLISNIKIKKTYGQMWQKINDKQYKIKILQLISGISKDYVFQIDIPKINTEVGDLDRDHNVIEAIFTANSVNGSKMSGECCFKITLINQNQEIPQINQNIDVIQNHLRVVASQAIDQNMKKAQKQQYQQAQNGIDSIINIIQSNKKARPQKMQYLVNDLKNIKQKCSKQDYQVQGKKWMKSAKMAHQQQKNFAYSNCIQQQMVTKQKAKKSKF